MLANRVRAAHDGELRIVLSVLVHVARVRLDCGIASLTRHEVLFNRTLERLVVLGKRAFDHSRPEQGRYSVRLHDER